MSQPCLSQVAVLFCKYCTYTTGGLTIGQNTGIVPIETSLDQWLNAILKDFSLGSTFWKDFIVTEGLATIFCGGMHLLAVVFTITIRFIDSILKMATFGFTFAGLCSSSSFPQ